MTTSPFSTETPVGTMRTIRSIPPTGGVINVTVRPARSSPLAWTFNSSDPLTTRVVGIPSDRSGRVGIPTAIAAPAAITTATSASHTILRFIAIS